MKQNHWVMLKKKGSILWLIFFGKKFSESCSKKKKSMLRVIFNKRVQFCESYSKKRFNSVNDIQETKGSILCVIFKKKDSIWWIELEKKYSILWVILNQKEVQFLKVIFFFSFLFFLKKNQVYESCSEEGSILRVMSKKNSFFESCKKGSILWVIVTKKTFNSFSHISRRVQFFES